jgi:hypothetical protein
MAMSPPHPPKKYEQNQTGIVMARKNEQRIPQLLGFFVTCPKVDNEPKAIPDITFFPPFALFLAP